MASIITKILVVVRRMKTTIGDSLRRLIFAFIKMVLFIAVRVRFWLYSIKIKYSRFILFEWLGIILWFSWVVVKFTLITPAYKFFSFLRTELGRRILVCMTWWPFIAYLILSGLWFSYIFTEREVTVIVNLARIPTLCDLSSSFVGLRLFFMLGIFLLLTILFVVRILKGSAPLSAGLVVVKTFVFSLLLLFVSQLHSVLFFVKSNFTSVQPNTGSTVLDFGWINVMRVLSDRLMHEYLSNYNTQVLNGSLSTEQMTEIIHSSGGSVDVAKMQATGLVEMASQTFLNALYSISGGVTHNVAVTSNFIATNPGFVALLSSMALFGGMRLYYRGLVGLCPLHTFDDFVSFLTTVSEKLFGSKKKLNPDDLIAQAWYGSELNPWGVPVSWYGGNWYGFCAAGWLGIEGHAYYTIFGHSLFQALKNRPLPSNFYGETTSHTDWYPPMQSISSSEITFESISSTVAGVSFLTNTVLEAVRELSIKSEQQRLHPLVVIDLEQQSQNNGSVSVNQSAPTTSLFVVEENANVPVSSDINTNTSAFSTDELEPEEEDFDGGVSSPNEPPHSPKIWDSPSRGWPRLHLGCYDDEEFRRLIESNDPESVGSSDGRTAASIAREAAREVDSHGWQTALDYEPVRRPLEEPPECPAHEKGKDKLYPEDNRGYFVPTFNWVYSIFSSAVYSINTIFASLFSKDNEHMPVSNNTAVTSGVTDNVINSALPEPQIIDIPKKVLDSLHPLHAADLEVYANSLVRDQIRSNGVGLISPNSPYLNKNLPMSANLSYLLFDVFGPITRFMFGGAMGVDWTFYLSIFAIGTSLTGRVVKVLDIFSGQEHLTPLISKGFATAEERAAVALYELQLDRNMKPTAASYYYPFPRAANLTLRLFGEKEFLGIYKDYIQLCIHRLTNVELLELKAAFADSAWSEMVAKSPQELGDFMLNHKSLGSYLLQSRNHSRLVMTHPSQSERDLFVRVDSDYYKPPTDSQIRSYLRTESVLIDAELKRREVPGQLDEWDRIHYAHILLRQGRFPTVPQSWLGPENLEVRNGMAVEVVREPPYFNSHEIQVYDSGNRHARVAQLIRVIEAGRGDAVCFCAPDSFEFKPITFEMLNPNSAVALPPTAELGESLII